MLEFLDSGLYFVQDERSYIKRVKNQRILPDPDHHPCKKNSVKIQPGN